LLSFIKGLRGCRTVPSPYKAPPGHVASKKCAKGAISAKSPLFRCRLAGFSSTTEALLQNFAGENIALRLQPSSTGDKRTTCLRMRYVLAIIPFVIRRLSFSGRGWPGLSGGVVFLKLSKPLNQEDALSAPCLRRESRSPQARPSGPHPCCGQRDPSL
jgi:hypothetical protein